MEITPRSLREILWAKLMAKQLPLFELPLPKHIEVIDTTGYDLEQEQDVEQIVLLMFSVPLYKSILLDFLVGRKRGDPLTEEQRELYRLQRLLNSRYRSKRFDFLGSSLTARLFRQSIRTEGWKPKL